MLAKLPEFTRRWRCGEYSDAAFGSIYFLLWQIERQGKRFASRRNRRDDVPDHLLWLTKLETVEPKALDRWLAETMRRYQFNGIIANVPAAMSNWLLGHWAIALCEYIPSPRQVLGMQAKGIRPVTVLSESERMHKPVLSKPDGFAFMVHDLEHAFKFFHDVELHAGQLRFFRALEEFEDSGAFSDLKAEPTFREKYDYLMSDMNTHAMHSLQYLRAILIEALLRLESKPLSSSLSETGVTYVDRLMRQMVAAMDA